MARMAGDRRSARTCSFTSCAACRSSRSDSIYLRRCENDEASVHGSSNNIAETASDEQGCPEGQYRGDGPLGSTALDHFSHLGALSRTASRSS